MSREFRAFIRIADDETENMQDRLEEVVRNQAINEFGNANVILVLIVEVAP